MNRELGWAGAWGSQRPGVSCTTWLWEQDGAGFPVAIDQFLAAATRHKIGVMFVLLAASGSVPHAGQAARPPAGLHNSGWVQSPAW